MLGRRTTFQEIALTTITIAGVAVLSITYALLNVNADALKRSAREYAVSVAENVAFRISNEVEDFENAVAQIINVFSSPGIATADKVELAKAIMVLESLDFIAVFDRNGHRQDVISSRPVTVQKNLPQTVRQSAIDHGRFYSLIDQGEDPAKLGILVPWWRNKEVFAFLYTEIDLSGMSAYTKDVSLSRLGSEDLVCVFDRAGSVILPLDEERKEFLASVLVSGFAADPMLENIFASDFVATYNYDDEEKGKMLGALISMPQLSWAVFIQQPYDVVYWNLGRMRKLSIVVGVLSLCLAILLAFLISRYITRSIAKLIYGVRQVAKRNFTFKVDIQSKNEIGELANTFNQMVDELNLHRKHIEQQQMRLELLARTDALTGLNNHRHFMEELNTEVQRSVHSGSPLSVMIIDIDEFKQINDTHGHLVGDRVLLAVAEIIKQHMSSTDIIARYGGDEFCVALSNTPVSRAKKLAQKIREEIADKEFTDDTDKRFHITCSIGLAEFDTRMESSLDILKFADQALYKAKKSGKNQVKERTTRSAT